MSDIYSQNLEVVTQRWPGLASRVSQTPAVAVHWDTQTPVVSMEVSGLRMHSAFDPLKEAEIQLQGILDTAKEVTLYGIGLGFLQRIALELLPQAIVRAVPMNLGIFRSSLEAVDHRDWLLNERCELIDPAEEGNVRLPFAAVPPCLHLSDESCVRLRDQIMLELNTAFIAQESTNSQAVRRKHIEANRNRLSTDGDVRQLFDSQKGREVLVAAAGPSLTGRLEWLARYRQDKCLIAVDAALRPLLSAGIVPDVVVAADAERENLLRYFRDDLSACASSVLVYLPMVHPDVLELWPGQRLAAYTNHAIFKALQREIPRGQLFLSGSVSHCALDLAVKSGASRITMLGFDFGFPGRMAHANPDVDASLFMQQMSGNSQVKDGYGNRIATAPNLLGYLRDLERYLLELDNVDLINASREGAYIAGTRYLDEV